MPQQRKYESKYGSIRKLTAAERLAEIMCERLAQKQGVSLANQFWRDDESYYAIQARTAHCLVDKLFFDEGTVFRVVDANPWIYSLAYPGLLDLLKEEQAKLDRLLTKPEPCPIQLAPGTGPPKVVSRDRQSIRAKLKDL